MLLDLPLQQPPRPPNRHRRYLLKEMSASARVRRRRKAKPKARKNSRPGNPRKRTKQSQWPNRPRQKTSRPTTNRRTRRRLKKTAEKTKTKADEPGKAPGEKVDALAAEPPAPPKYEAYKLPDNFKPDDARIEKFNTLLGEAEVSGKADHKVIQELGQKLVDFHAEEMQRVAKEVTKFQIDTWNRYKEGKVNELKADPEIGGNRIETTLGNAKYAFDNYLGLSADQRSKLMVALDNAGISSDPEFIRGLNNLYERLKPPESVQPNLPSKSAKGDRNRNWYETTDGVSTA